MKFFLNPLQFFEVEGALAAIEPQEVTPGAILNFMCTPGIGSDVDSIIARYKKISASKSKLFVAPYEERILDKLIWPLKHAKASYMMGNYLGTIALCGMVSEMVAILIHDISNFKLNNKPMTEKDQINVFGRKFEKLGQDRRVQILHAYDLIDVDLEKAFELIRVTRNKYLHLWSQDHDDLPADAIASYESAVLIVVLAIGQDIHDGKIVLKPSLVNYLDQKGAFKETNDEIL